MKNTTENLVNIIIATRVKSRIQIKKGNFLPNLMFQDSIFKVHFDQAGYGWMGAVAQRNFNKQQLRTSKNYFSS